MLDFVKKLPRALPGLILIVATLYAIRTWVEPWMEDLWSSARRAG